MPIENPLVFYTRYGAETVAKLFRYGALYWRYRSILKRVQRTPSTGVDVAMQPVQDADLEALELFTVTAGARAAADKQRRRKAALAETVD
jgi:hypothetical protein